jgi:hypothetical protein
MRSRARRSVWVVLLVVGVGATLLAAGCESESPSSTRKRPKRSAEEAETGRPPTQTKPPSTSWQEPGNYYGAVTHSKTFAETRKCRGRLATLKKELDLYHAMNGQFPPSLAALNRSDLTKCPYRRGGAYSYVPGQTNESPGGNILVYEAGAPHEGKAHALRVDGTVVSLTPEAMQAELAKNR